MKVLVIGHPDAVLGFSLAGVHGESVSTADDANAALDRALKSKDTGIILVTRDIARLVGQRIEELKIRSTIPLVVEIPSPEGVPADEPSLGDVVLRAIGIKL